MRLFTLFISAFLAVPFSPGLLAKQTQLLFATELEAITAAANLYNPRSIREDREYMGTIFFNDGLFGYTVTAGVPGANSVSIAVPVDEWDQVVAFWHTHGDDRFMHRYFSNLDTASVKQTGKPLYLADYTGYLKKFSPGDRVMSAYWAKRLDLPPDDGFAIGNYVTDESNRRVRIRTLESQGSG